MMNTFYNKTFSFIQIQKQLFQQRIMTMVIIPKVTLYFFEILLWLLFLLFFCRTARELQKTADKQKRL